MKYNILQDKSFRLAIRIVNLYKHLIDKRKEFVISKQLLRSGTSIGANVEEAIGGQSKKDFIAKIGIVYKESRETIYWIKILRETGYLSAVESGSILMDTEEVIKITAAILKSSKSTNS